MSEQRAGASPRPHGHCVEAYSVAQPPRTWSEVASPTTKLQNQRKQRERSTAVSACPSSSKPSEIFEGWKEPRIFQIIQEHTIIKQQKFTAWEGESYFAATPNSFLLGQA